MGKKKKTTIGYKYFMGLHMGICRGPLDAIRQIRVGGKVAWTGKAAGNTTINIHQPGLFGGEEQEGGIDGNLVVLMGAKDQPRHEGLASMLGGLVSAFRGVCTAYFDGLVCAMSPYPKEWSFLAQKTLAGWHRGEVWYPEKCEIPLIAEVAAYDDVWAYKMVPMGNSADYSGADFDDSSWTTGRGAFGNRVYGADAPQINTYLPYVQGASIWVRGKVLGTASGYQVEVRHDNDAQLWWNGQPVELEFVFGDSENTAKSVGVIPGHLIQSSNVVVLKVTDTGPNAICAGMRVIPSTVEIIGMNPAHVLYRAYTDPRIGRGLSASRLDLSAWKAAADVWHSEGLGLCMKWSQSTSVAEFCQAVIDHAGAVIYPNRKTGLIVVKAIRDDYEIDDLPLYTPDSGLLGFDDDSSSSQASGINEIVVKYYDQAEKAEKAVREKNLGMVLAMGGITVSEEVSYDGIATEALARRLARRDLTAKSGFIKRFEVRLDRRGKDIMPGHVFRISDPFRGIENMVLRAGRVEYGTATDGTVTVTALQDVFGLPQTVYRAVEEGGYKPPDSAPRPAALQRVIEAPYRELVQSLGQAEAESLNAFSGYLHGMAVAPTALSESFALDSRVVPADFKTQTDAGMFCPGGLLTTDITKTQATIVLEEAVHLAVVEVGMAALLGDEIIRIDAVDVSTATLTIARGCADTVPSVHLAGTALFCYDSWGADDRTDYIQGVTVQAKLRTRTSSGTQSEAAAQTHSLTFVGRAARPYPPAGVLINGTPDPDVVMGDLSITWSHRNRLVQADQLIDNSLPSIDPEPGTAYGLELYDAQAETLLHSVHDITGNTVEIPANKLASRTRVELYSVRDGLECLQRQIAQVMTGLEISGVLPVALNLEFYSAQLAVSASATDVYWSVLAGRLPAGLHLDEHTGLISGVPNGVAGYYSVTVRAQIEGAAVAKALDIRVGDIVSMLHFDGDTGSTLFTDQSGKTWTSGGGTQLLSDLQASGGIAAVFDGASSYLNTPAAAGFDASDQDFTFAARIKTSKSTGVIASNKGIGGVQYVNWGLSLRDGKLRAEFGNQSGGAGSLIATVAGSTAVSDDAWHRLEISKQGLTVRMFVEGALEATQTLSSHPFAGSSGSFWLGFEQNQGSTEHFQGSMDEVLMVKGIALHSTAFTAEDPKQSYPQPVSAVSMNGSLPPGIAGAAYSSTQAIAIQGAGPWVVSVTRGSLPAGWSATVNGSHVEVAGPGASEGFYTFTLTATDESSSSASLPLTVRID